MASGFGTLPAMVNRSRVLEIIVVLGFCLFLFAYGLGSFGLTGADEPRYAQIAREMLARHDWVTPVLYGEVWLEKPILYYWLAILYGTRKQIFITFAPWVLITIYKQPTQTIATLTQGTM